MYILDKSSAQNCTQSFFLDFSRAASYQRKRGRPIRPTPSILALATLRLNERGGASVFAHLLYLFALFCQLLNMRYKRHEYVFENQSTHWYTCWYRSCLPGIWRMEGRRFAIDHRANCERQSYAAIWWSFGRMGIDPVRIKRVFIADLRNWGASLTRSSFFWPLVAIGYARTTNHKLVSTSLSVALQ